MKLKYLLITVQVLLALSLSGQVRPDQFDEELTPNDSNFEVYSQKNGDLRRARPSSFQPLYSPKAQVFPVSYTPTVSGNVNNLNEVVSDPAGDVYLIDYRGNSILLSTGGASAQPDEYFETQVVSGSTIVPSIPLPASGFNLNMEVYRSGVLMTYNVDFTIIAGKIH